MWQRMSGYYQHVEHPQWEIHPGTQGSRFELRNTTANTCVPLFRDQPNASIQVVMNIVDDAILGQEFLKSIGG